MPGPRPLLLLSSLWLACGPDARGNLATQTEPNAATETGDDETGTPDGERFDLGQAVAPEPCSKVDLLFVIDDSMSMEDEQSALIAAFPDFVDDIEQRLSALTSYHIGVVTTDPYIHNEPGCQELGQLVTRTGGEGASAEDCAPFASGHRYLDETEPDLVDKFTCAARVGARGMPGEEQIGAVLEAINPINGVAKSCNTGFVRPDALLVVVLISDEDDATSCFPGGCVGGTSGDPQAWYEELVALKGGIETNVVMLSIVGGPGAYWDCGVEDAPRIAEFTQRFTNGRVGDICHMDFGTYFENAIDVVLDGCDGFTPVG